MRRWWLVVLGLENRGQGPADARFLARGNGYRLGLRESALQLTLADTQETLRQTPAGGRY